MDLKWDGRNEPFTILSSTLITVRNSKCADVMSVHELTSFLGVLLHATTWPVMTLQCDFKCWLNLNNWLRHKWMRINTRRKNFESGEAWSDVLICHPSEDRCMNHASQIVQIIPEPKSQIRNSQDSIMLYHTTCTPASFSCSPATRGFSWAVQRDRYLRR